jgi:stearoyl-CoA desaturase (Delta-9 desaturase)
MQEAESPLSVQVKVVSRKFGNLSVVGFFLIHAGCLAAFFLPIRWEWIALAIGSYLIRMFAVTAGYHRYFSHRSFKLNRFWQFILAFMAQTSGQKSVLWWAAHHRVHHRNSDREGDVHSPILQGLWWSHVGWIVSTRHEGYDPRLINDFRKFPELRFLDRYDLLPTVLYGAAFWLVGGFGAFMWGFVISTVILYHATFAINSMAHLWGTRRFDTADHSRNNFLLALVTLGEGWHNNHHQFMHACRQGMRWWEVDFTYYGLKILSWVGIVKDIREHGHTEVLGAQSAA